MDIIINLISGIPPVAELIATGMLILASAYNIQFRTYVTYILTNPDTGQIYIGRASGFGVLQKIVQRRLYNHDFYQLGFTVIQLDKAMQGRMGRRAIRGREQQLIDFYGGIGSPLIANRIRAISIFNPNKNKYYEAAIKYFGEL